MTSQRPPTSGIIRRLSMDTCMVRIYTGPLSQEPEFVSVEADKLTTSDDVVKITAIKLKLSDPDEYELAEVFNSADQLCKERRLEGSENPVRIKLMWPRVINAELDAGLHTGFRFYLRKKNLENTQRTSSWIECMDPNPEDTFLTDFLKRPHSKEYSDLCNLPDLNERTLLENIKSRFQSANIYTYVGSILIAVNPFKFFPIYNPIYVQMYQNKRLGDPDLPPHIFAIADAAFHTMLRTKRNQCIVISGESGSGKTESTTLLLHHLTALSHKGLHGSGVEQTILGAGPVLEAFGNAKTIHNNNSSRFGKFIQVNYKENGMVHGAIVEKYLLEKSRIVSQARSERNYHVFYYLLAGADELEREKLFLGKPENYFYLCQTDYNDELDEGDDVSEFARLRQSMEMVGFSQVTQKRIFGVLSAVLHLGNVQFKKKGDQHHDESVSIGNPDTIRIISNLLKVKEKILVEALTQKKATAGGETVVINYKMEDAVATRDAMAKCLYGALFDWIVLKVNQALLAKRHNSEHQGNSIGVLDIFGFEDFVKNSFEQLCINYANEHLQYYFNQHIFKFEQEEYKKEGIHWKNIEFIDNTGCLDLFSRKPNGLFSLLDEECNFPGASNETLLSKFHHHHAKGSVYYVAPQKKEMAFVVVHYAGKVKYLVKDFREKNSDQIRTDIVGNLKSSSLSFVRELMGVDPVAVLRWAIVKTLIKSVFAFISAGEKYRKRGGPEKRKPHENKDHLRLPADIAQRDSFLRQRSSPQDLSSRPSQTSRPPSNRTKLHDTLPPTHATSLDVQRRHRKSPNRTPHRYQKEEHDEELVDEVFPRSPRHSGHLKSPVDPYLSEDEAKLMRRATKVMMKNKSFKPKARPQTMFSDIKTLKAIASRTMYVGGKTTTKKQPPSVGAQFQWSLSRLMATLNQANPFFIRCIKSNAEKQACKFDDVLVLRQLRYTGMLATVRIRQSGYNYRLKFEEFIQLYKILLPKGLLSSKEDVRSFLQEIDLNQDNYQIGLTKVFLREGEKRHLDRSLHCAIMKRIITIQRWIKTKVDRKAYLQLRENTIIIQKCVRTYLAERRHHRFRNAALTIQRFYRGSVERKKYVLVRRAAIRIQATLKGHLDRKRVKRMREEVEQNKLKEDMHSSTSDERVLIKGVSTEDLDRDFHSIQRNDSTESSGILDDSESDTVSETKSHGESVSSHPQTPTSPNIEVERFPTNKDEFLTQGRQSKVKDMSQKFQQMLTTEDDLDGRSPSGHRFIRRGSPRKRPSKIAAPLAKQESFSDLDSPTSDSKRSPPSQEKISPEKMKAIEDTLKKQKVPPGGSSLEVPGEGTHGRSTFRTFQRRIVDTLTNNPTGSLRETKSFPSSDTDSLRRKYSYSSFSLLRRTKSSIKLLRDKSSGGHESEGQGRTTKRPQNLGVAVLPMNTGSPKSPKEGSSTFFSADESSTSDTGQKKAKKTRRKPEKDQRRDGERKASPQRGNWNLTNTQQWQYPDDFIITEVYELMLLDEYINMKMNGLIKNSSPKESIFDKIFMKTIRTFHHDLKSTLSVQLQKGDPSTCNIKYRALFAMFGKILVASLEDEKTEDKKNFPQPLVMNAFRGYLDEFRNTVNQKKKDKKHVKKTYRGRKQDKLKKDSIDYQGHKFNQVQFGIPTFCELCSHIIWIMEKGHVCQVCKYTCHKKCIFKSSMHCKGGAYAGIDPERPMGTRVFSIPLSNLVSEKCKVPEFMENLINEIELNGLYTEGLYRKSGSAPKVKMLKAFLDTGQTEASIDDHNIHVLTTTLKCFLRELPEPLLSFEYFDEFLQAADIKDEKEIVQSLFSIIERLPKCNYDVLERLVFHLARVAMHESSNKMSVNGLAIIFAPCLLRTNKCIQAQESLNQVPRQTICIERILEEQLKKLKTTLQDINTLECAEATAADRLSEVRASMRNTKVGQTKTASPAPVMEEGEALDEQEKALSSHIQSIRKEREDLTSALPTLEYRHSSDDEMLSVEDMDSTYDTADDMEDDLTFDVMETHQMKHSDHTPKRRGSHSGHSVTPHHKDSDVQQDLKPNADIHVADSKHDKHGDSRHDYTHGDSRHDYKHGDSKHDKLKDSKYGKQEDSVNDNPGDSKHDNPGDSKHDNPGDSKHDNPGDSKHDNPGDSKHDNPGDSKHDKKGDSKQDKKGDSKQDKKGDSNHDNPGDSNHDKKGDSNHDKTGDSNHDNPGDSKHDKTGDSNHDNHRSSNGKKHGDITISNGGDSKAEAHQTIKEDKHVVLKSDKPIDSKLAHEHGAFNPQDSKSNAEKLQDSKSESADSNRVTKSCPDHRTTQPCDDLLDFTSAGHTTTTQASPAEQPIKLTRPAVLHSPPSDSRKYESPRAFSLLASPRLSAMHEHRPPSSSTSVSQQQARRSATVDPRSRSKGLTSGASSRSDLKAGSHSLQLLAEHLDINPEERQNLTTVFGHDDDDEIMV